MPLDPVLADRLHLLDGLTTWRDVDTPEKAARLVGWDTDPVPYTRPDVETAEIPLAAAGHEFRVRVYGHGDSDSPCLVWSHGGGFVVGTLDMNEADIVAREVAVRAGAVVVSVDYTLAPAAQYPVLHSQVAAAWTWAVDHRAELGIDSRRVSIGGASAGAALSLSATRELVSRGGASPAAMLLAYPVAHRSWDLDPVQQEAMAPLPPVLRIAVEPDGPLNRAYLGDHPDPVFAFLAPDGTGVAGLPPTYVVVCEYDDLRTTGELFVRQARAAGVPVELALATGLVHGHLNRTPALPQVDATLRDMARVVVEATVHAG